MVPMRPVEDQVPVPSYNQLVPCCSKSPPLTPRYSDDVPAFTVYALPPTEASVSVCALVKLKPAGEANPPSVPTWLPMNCVAVPSVVGPAALPVSVAAVMLPPAPPSMVPADCSVTSRADKAPAIVTPPLVVCSVMPLPPLTVPATVSASPFSRLKPFAVELPSVAIMFAGSSAVLPVDWPVRVPAVTTPLLPSLIAPPESSVVVPPPLFTPALIARPLPPLRVTALPATLPLTVNAPAVVARLVAPLPLFTAPATVSACALFRLKPFALNPPRLPTWFAPFNAAAPAALPIRVPAVMTPLPPSPIAPPEASVVVPLPLFTPPLIERPLPPSRLTVPPATLPLMVSAPAVVARLVAPLPPLTAPPTVNACVLLRLKPFAVKLSRFAIALAPPSAAAPLALPISVPAVMAPPLPSLIAPPELSVVLPAPLFTLPLMPRPSCPPSATEAPATLPYTVSAPAVVAMPVAPLPPFTVPATVSACAFVRPKPFAPKLPSVPIWFAPFSAVAPAALPVSVPAAMTPLLPSPMAPAEVSVVVPLPLFTLPSTVRLPDVVASVTPA